MLLLAVAMPGCKKKEPPPPPPTVTPLPKKADQGAPVPATQPAKPVQTAQSSAKKNPAAGMLQGQMTSSKRTTALNGASLDFTSRRDPFKPYAQIPLQQSATAGNSKIKVRDPLPIQKFETEKFRISGIVTGLKENTALIIDPTNKGYVVKRGMLIGSSEGVVKNITSNSVEVEESYRDDKGRIKKRVVKLTLLRKK